MPTAFVSNPQDLCALRERALALAVNGGLTPSHRRELQQLALGKGLDWDECEIALADLPEREEVPLPIYTPPARRSGGDNYDWIFGMLILLSVRLGPTVWQKLHPPPPPAPLPIQRQMPPLWSERTLGSQTAAILQGQRP